MKKIIETVTEDKSLSTLLSAINKSKAKLLGQDNVTYTLLAPNDEAFAKLGDEKLKAILNDDNKLNELLSYHIIESKVLGKDASGVKEIITQQGGKIMIDVTDGVMFNNAKIVKADIDCLDGVVHIIDTVLLPK